MALFLNYQSLSCNSAPLPNLVYSTCTSLYSLIIPCFSVQHYKLSLYSPLHSCQISFLLERHKSIQLDGKRQISPLCTQEHNSSHDGFEHITRKLKHVKTLDHLLLTLDVCLSAYEYLHQARILLMLSFMKSVYIQLHNLAVSLLLALVPIEK